MKNTWQHSHQVISEKKHIKKKNSTDEYTVHLWMVMVNINVHFQTTKVIYKSKPSNRLSLKTKLMLPFQMLIFTDGDSRTCFVTRPGNLMKGKNTSVKILYGKVCESTIFVWPNSRQAQYWQKYYLNTVICRRHKMCCDKNNWQVAHYTKKILQRLEQGWKILLTIFKKVRSQCYTQFISSVNNPSQRTVRTEQQHLQIPYLTQDTR